MLCEWYFFSSLTLIALRVRDQIIAGDPLGMSSPYSSMAGVLRMDIFVRHVPARVVLEDPIATHPRIPLELALMQAARRGAVCKYLPILHHLCGKYDDCSSCELVPILSNIGDNTVPRDYFGQQPSMTFDSRDKGHAGDYVPYLASEACTLGKGSSVLTLMPFSDGEVQWPIMSLCEVHGLHDDGTVELRGLATETGVVAGSLADHVFVMKPEMFQPLDGAYRDRKGVARMQVPLDTALNINLHRCACGQCGVVFVLPHVLLAKGPPSPCSSACCICTALWNNEIRTWSR